MEGQLQDDITKCQNGIHVIKLAQIFTNVISFSEIVMHPLILTF